MKESAIQDRIMKWLRSEFPTGQWRKRPAGVTGTVAGDPDIYGSLCGVHVEMEVKKPGEQPTELQMYRAMEWVNAGAAYAWVTDLAGAKVFLMKIKADIAAKCEERKRSRKDEDDRKRDDRENVLPVPVPLDDRAGN